MRVSFENVEPCGAFVLPLDIPHGIDVLDQYILFQSNAVTSVVKRIISYDVDVVTMSHKESMHAELKRLRDKEERMKVPKGEGRIEFRVREGTELWVDGGTKGKIQGGETWILSIQKPHQKYTRVELVEE
jgi:hypothetical protein